MKIIVDAMGGDNAPLEIVKGALQAQKRFGVDIVFTGDEAAILDAVRACGLTELPDGAAIIPTAETVEMCDDPATVFRRKKDTSMGVGLTLLKNGGGDAMVSAGSTGALLTGATLITKRIHGIRRAAMAPVIPTTTGSAVLIDCGANAECTPEYLVQFAYLGNFYAQRVLGVATPRVGLLNIGAEDSKGTDLQKQTLALLRAADARGDLHFIGNIEAKDAIKGGCFDAREPGYVEGKPGSFWDIGAAVAAWCRSDRLPPHAPSQIVSYVSAHDNFTLWDKLLMVRYERPEFRAVDKAALAQNRLAAGIYLTSMGLPYWQAGEEFARTKKGKGNSYRSSPALNRLDWERAEKYHALVDYYRGLLALRARFPRLSSTDPHAPDALHFFSLEQPLVGWLLPAQWGDGAAWQALCVFYNPTDASGTVPLPVGRWQMLSDGISSSLWRGPARVCEHEAVLMPYSATIFGQI